MLKLIKKRSGIIVNFEPNKLNKWAEWASNNNVDWSEVALKAYSKCFDGCTTKDLQQALIDACLEFQSTKHFKMAGRLLIGDIYKSAFGTIVIPELYDFYQKMVRLDLWEEMNYTKEEFEYLNSFIDHKKDLQLGYSEVKQLKDKYLITDRTTKKCFESPQFMFMGMALANMQNQPKERRLNDVIKLYQYLSDKKINAPTPFMSNLRTKHRGYASCCVYNTLDTAKSLAAGDHIAYMMTCASAGIGANVITRSKGDPVRNGTIEHQGKRGYYTMIQSAVKANLQNSRGGSATVHCTVLDPEIEDILSLKSVTTPTNLRIAGVDYSIGFNSYFIEKVQNNEQWMLVSLVNANELYSALYSNDIEKFKEEYSKYLNSDKPKTLIDARSLANEILKQSIETGRIYLHMIDAMNTHTPFKEPIYLSNLCLVGSTNVHVLVDGIEKICTLKEVDDFFKNGNRVEIKSYNTQKEKVQYKKVTASMMTGSSKKVIKITDTETGKSIMCTPEHKVYTENRGYVEAKDLTENDVLNILSGSSGSSIKVENVDELFDVYDITVEDNHNFYANDILVHNCQEIALPTNGYNDVTELYNNESETYVITLENNQVIKIKYNTDVKLISGEYKKIQELTNNDEIDDVWANMRFI